MNTFVVTVTYGNRFHLLKKVIERAHHEGVLKVIVVDNNSALESRDKLKAFEEKLGEDKIKVIYLDNNCGSAGGFKKGLEEAYNDKRAEYILALDDDNLIAEGSISKLKNLMGYLNINHDYMLSFYRDLRKDNNRIVKEGWVKRYLPNNFAGFNFLNQLKNKFSKVKNNNCIDFFPLHPIQLTAMGGSFFHKSVLKNIGFPNEEFYLYAEDHDFSYRFTQSGGYIFLCSELKLQDLDSTSTSAEGENIDYFDDEFSEFKMYYQVRNHVYFSQNFIENKILFYANLVMYLLFNFRKIFKTPLKLFLKRYLLLIRAIKDGLNGNLGKIY